MPNIDYCTWSALFIPITQMKKWKFRDCAGQTLRWPHVPCCLVSLPYMPCVIPSSSVWARSVTCFLTNRICQSWWITPMITIHYIRLHLANRLWRSKLPWLLHLQEILQIIWGRLELGPFPVELLMRNQSQLKPSLQSCEALRREPS